MQSNDVRILSIRENAKAELQQLKTIEDGMVHLSKLEGIEAWVKAQKLDAEIHSLVLEQELRTKRIVGQLLKFGKENGEVLKPGETKTQSNQYISGAVVENNSGKKSISDLGLTRDQSRQFQKIASIPEEVFEEHIAEAKAEVDTAVKKLTVTGALKLAEGIDPKREAMQSAQRIGEKLEREAIVKKYVDEINALPKFCRMQIKERIK